MFKKLFVLILWFGVTVTGVRGQAPTEGKLIYVGTYTGARSKGIHAFRFNNVTGTLTSVGLVAETRSPSWLVLHPSGQYLYAANEVDDVDADKSGSVSAFRIDAATGALTLINTQPSRGAHPCHMAVDRAGTHLLVANYTGGTLAVLPLESNGSLGAPSQVVHHKGSSTNADASVGAACAFDRPGRRQPLCDLRGPGRRPALHLPLRRQRRWPVGWLATGRRRDARRRAAALRVSSERPVGVCHQRAVLDRDGLPVERPARGAHDAGDDLHAAARIPREQLDRRDPRASQWPVPVRLQPRPRQHCGLPGCRHQRQPDAGRAPTDARQDAPQLHHRPHAASGSSPPTRTATRWRSSASATTTAR